MPSIVVCDRGHKGGNCREAAIELWQQGSLASCQRSGCDAPRRYVVRHFYANLGEWHEWEVAKVARLSPEVARDAGYDPMMFLLRDRRTGEAAAWPFFWGLDGSGRWRVGQFPPILTLSDYMRLVQALEG